MIENKAITYYKKGLDNNKIETWTKYLFKHTWVFSTRASSVMQGYENSNKMDIRIPMRWIKNKGIFNIGDIVAIGIQGDITKQSDLSGKEFYNVTSVKINDFGSNPHVHLGGN